MPGTIAFFLDRPLEPASLPDLFAGEWGHIHPHYDGSLHLNLPTPDAETLIELGWAEYHNVVLRGLVPPIVVLFYGPRDEHEFAVAASAVETAYLAAGGGATALLDQTLTRLTPRASGF